MNFNVYLLLALFMSNAVMAKPFIFATTQLSFDSDLLELGGSPSAQDTKGYGYNLGWAFKPFPLLERKKALYLEFEYAYHTAINSTFPCDECLLENTLSHHDARATLAPRLINFATMQLDLLLGVNRAYVDGVLQNQDWHQWVTGWHAGIKIQPEATSPYPVTWKLNYSMLPVMFDNDKYSVSVWALSLGYQW